MTDSIFGLPNNNIILNQFVPAALELLQNLPKQAQMQINGLTLNRTASGNKIYSYNTKSIKNDTYSEPARVKLNSLRFGVGFFRTTMCKWEMASTPIYECDVIMRN